MSLSLFKHISIVKDEDERNKLCILMDGWKLSTYWQCLLHMDGFVKGHDIVGDSTLLKLDAL